MLSQRVNNFQGKITTHFKTSSQIKLSKLRTNFTAAFIERILSLAEPMWKQF
jgi:hypothetical protein